MCDVIYNACQGSTSAMSLGISVDSATASVFTMICTRGRLPGTICALALPLFGDMTMRSKRLRATKRLSWLTTIRTQCWLSSQTNYSALTIAEHANYQYQVVVITWVRNTCNSLGASCEVIHNSLNRKQTQLHFRVGVTISWVGLLYFLQV